MRIEIVYLRRYNKTSSNWKILKILWRKILRWNLMLKRKNRKQIERYVSRKRQVKPPDLIEGRPLLSTWSAKKAILYALTIYHLSFLIIPLHVLSQLNKNLNPLPRCSKIYSCKKVLAPVLVKKKMMQCRTLREDQVH